MHRSENQCLLVATVLRMQPTEGDGVKVILIPKRCSSLFLGKKLELFWNRDTFSKKIIFMILSLFLHFFHDFNCEY